MTKRHNEKNRQGALRAVKKLERRAHCRGCNTNFETFLRTVEGPNGPMKIEEDLCLRCRRKAKVWFEEDEGTVINEELDTIFLNTTGKRRENPPE